MQGCLPGQGVSSLPTCMFEINGVRIFLSPKGHISLANATPLLVPFADTEFACRKKEHMKQGGEKVGHKEKSEVRKWMVIWMVKFSI